MAPLKAFAPDVPDLIVYPGSTVSQCQVCGQDIYVGPKAQEVIKSRKTYLLVCMLCGVRTATANGLGEGDVQELGNTYLPGDRPYPGQKEGL